jgi:pheromone shutdown protein TraB
MVQSTWWPPHWLLRVVLFCVVIPAHGHNGASFFWQSNHGWLLLRYRGGGSRVVDEKSVSVKDTPSTTTGLSTPPLPSVPWDAETLSESQANVEQLNSENATTRIRRQPVVPSWKESLPERLRRKGPKTLQKICLGSTDIYLLGTAHVSNDSSTDVQMLLEHVHPDCIFVELCDARIALLVGDSDGSSHSSAVSTNTSATAAAAAAAVDSASTKVSFWKRWQAATQQAQGGSDSGTSRWQALSTVLLSRVQEDYAKELGVELGGEFRSAHAYWLAATSSATASTTAERTSHFHVPKSSKPVHLVLGDRPLHLTIVRAWESLSFWPKVKLVVGLLWSSLRRPNKEEIRAWLESVMHEESDVLTKSFAELRHHFPTLYTTILSERDAWLAAKLVQTCRVLQTVTTTPTAHLPDNSRPKTTIVAIVGAGHVPGICDWLTHGPTTSSTTTGTTTTPEHVLAELVTTRRWAHDALVQNQAIPMWIHEVSALTDPTTIVPC